MKIIFRLSQCFQGKLKLPSEQKMNEAIDEYLEWGKRVVWKQNNGTKLSFYGMHIMDEMLKDMNIPIQRASNFFTEYFVPVWPERFNISQELKTGKAKTYISFWHILLVIIIVFYMFTL